jgi:hypothetical protein
MYARVKVRFPSPQGTSSTTTARQRRQSTRRIEYSRKTENPQKGYELEAALRKLIASGVGLVTARANRLRALAGSHRDFDALVIRAEAGLLINESGKTVTTI